MELVSNYHDLMDRGAPKLDKILKHEDLFKIYPELKDINVVLTENGSALHRYGKTMVIQIDKQADFKSTLFHEIQHAIQELDSFEKGGDPYYISNKYNLPFDKAFQEYLNLPGEQEARFTQNNFGTKQATLDAKIKELLQAESTPGYPKKLYAVPKSQRGGIDIKVMEDAVAKITDKIKNLS